ncbi:hypothetical protein MferCBS31731_006876 [Microsporum ferrugineum]
MLFTKYFALLAATFAVQATAYPAAFASAPEAIAHLDPISESIENVSQMINQSPGGISELMMITNSIYDVCDKAKTSRKRIDGMAPLTKQEEIEGKPHLARLFHGLISAVKATSSKVPLVKAVPGGTIIAKRVANRVGEEKAGLQDILKDKCSPEAYQDFLPIINDFDKEFGSLMLELSGGI